MGTSARVMPSLNLLTRDQDIRVARRARYCLLRHLISPGRYSTYRLVRDEGAKSKSLPERL